MYSELAPSRLTAPPTSKVGNGWNSCCMSYGTFATPFPDVWRNNTCITASVGKAQWDMHCNPNAPTDGNAPIFSGNTYANPGAEYGFPCGKNGTRLTLAEAQAVGQDVGSTVTTPPSTEEILAAGHALLQF